MYIEFLIATVIILAIGIKSALPGPNYKGGGAKISILRVIIAGDQSGNFQQCHKIHSSFGLLKYIDSNHIHPCRTLHRNSNPS
jgi:hypothetical protein